MTVAELMEKLQQYPADMPVLYFGVYDGIGYVDIEDVTLCREPRSLIHPDEYVGII